MKIVILGAGIIGITTAFELLKSGHEVTIIDRQAEPAMETSFGNAGLIAPGHSYAWTTPKLPGNLFKSICQHNQIGFSCNQAQNHPLFFISVENQTSPPSRIQ